MDFAVQHARRRPPLIALSHLRWDFVFQRPQHLLTRAAIDYDVVVIEEPIWDDVRSLGVNVFVRDGGIRIVQPVLPHGTSTADAQDHQKRILDDLVSDCGTDGLVFWYYTPMALQFSRHIKAGVTIFDKMDELSAFTNAPPVLLTLEQELFRRADIVFTGGASMHEVAMNRHSHIYCFPSSIDTGHFNSARTGSLADPSDQTAIAHPRIGFFGVIDERMDLALVDKISTARPDWQFVMIGPVAKIDPGDLPTGANVRWLGSKSYGELPAYLSGWDVGFMPFAINEATKFISPTKTPEFLAAGLPVVSTAIRDVVQPYGDKKLVEIASTPVAVIAAIERLLSKHDRTAWLAAVDAQLSQGSWDRVWSEMHGAILALNKDRSALQPTKETIDV